MVYGAQDSLSKQMTFSEIQYAWLLLFSVGIILSQALGDSFTTTFLHVCQTWRILPSLTQRWFAGTETVKAEIDLFAGLLSE